MKWFREIRLKTRLVIGFASVVVLTSLLSSLVFTFILVSTMRRSAKEKIEETSKVALSFVEEVTRGLKIYADLIASDMTFGQVLSFDSAAGIGGKIEEFSKLSGSDLVAFVPKGERYVVIKDEIFLSQGNESASGFLKSYKPIQGLLDQSESAAEKGWIALGDEVYLFAMKPVLHFGANMGVIFLAKRWNDNLARDLATASGTEIILFNEKKVFGASLAPGGKTLASLPLQAEYASTNEPRSLVENYRVGETTYFSLFLPIVGNEGKRISTLALNVSSDSIRNARNETVRRVLMVAVLATLLSGFIGFYLARAISNPLQNITRGIVSIMEKGDLGIRIPGVFGAEIGSLTGSFNRLLEQLQEAHDKLAASERRMKEELTMASTVQEMLFPEKVVTYGNFELASFIDTSSETGGDWFGYGGDRSGKNVTVLMGDVTGHGMPAALITAIANGFFHGVQETEDAVRQVITELEKSTPDFGKDQATRVIYEQFAERHSLSTSDLLEILNQIILKSTKGNLLMTFFASVYDPSRGLLRYANAGHNRPFLCQSMSGGDLKIGVLPSEPSQRLGENVEVRFVENEISVGPKDMIVWYTDGIIECENEKGEMYGKRRMMNVLRRCAAMHSEEIMKAVIADAYDFYGSTARKDDITLVVGKSVR